jgi:membrane protease YdiL (CAAX protease family)
MPGNHQRKIAIRGFPSAGGFGRLNVMRNDASGDVLKVWLYAVASVVLGAWISPLLYNAGKALAEVSSNKTTNGILEWLAGVCRAAEFPRFYHAGVLLAALVLFLPWMEWIHARRGVEVAGAGPWRLRLPAGARVLSRGQPLRRNLMGLWHGCAGFMLVAGLLLSLGVALVPAGYFTMSVPGGGMSGLVLRTLIGSMVVAVLVEVFFRGVAMGIFLRAMRPAAALGMCAAFFALVCAVIPPPGLNVPDPEAGGTGFELLRLMLAGFADWRSVLGDFAPMLALGFVLAYARWRTASLCLPVGLHSGWLFSKSLLAKLSAATGTGGVAISGGLLQQGLVPLVAIVLAGFLAHYITAHEVHESTVEI